MRTLRTHRSRAVAALCVGALTISACGGTDNASSSDSSSNAAAVATTVAAEPPTDTPAPTTDTLVADAPATSSPASTDADTPVAQGAPDVPEILQVSAPLVGGGGIDLADYADRPLLLWFWAPF